ncbi:hypothetical protein FB451DRAFT_1171033 [Mycena latifolia]|nr:hypothetical protein FB451DRAFT_1171033 [Mycena latifolia]
MSVLTLSQYSDLIDLSSPTDSPYESGQSLDEAYGIAIDYLDPEDALAHLDEDTAIRALLTVRDASLGPLPDEVLLAVDTILAAKLASATLTSVDSIPLLTSLFPSTSTTLPPSFSKISFFRGDITRISSPRLAIVNACNSALLGCFRPSHLCVDNVIHSAAGPRLRADCYTIMQAQGIPEPDGRAKVTKAWSLPSAYVLHTVGPQLNKGQAPTKEEEQALFNCYTSCLDLADELGTIDAVAFPCISTGLFAFPGDIASQLALRAVDEWLAAHPSSTMRVIFTLFLPAGVAHYSHALKVVFPSISAESPKKLLPLIPTQVIQAIKDADAIMIRAGAGLSADAVHRELGLGLDYTSPTVFSALYPGLVKSTRMRRLYDTFGNDFPDVNTAWAFRLLHAHTILTWGPTPVYEALHKLVRTVPKEYFVITSNADRLFYNSGFDASRIYSPQGTYALLQCMKPCTPNSFFPVQPWIDRALPHLNRETMRFPDSAHFEAELRPRCPKCGSTDVFLNVRAADWFLETPQAAERAAYTRFCAENLKVGRKVVLLELGCGFNTPSVIRWPGEHMAAAGEGSVLLVRINGNARDAGVPEELVKQGTGVGLNMGVVEFLETLEDTGVYPLMPPRARGRGRGGAQRGAGRGQPQPQLQPQPQPQPQPSFQPPPAHITTVGVRRPGYGSNGILIPVDVNAFVATMPDGFRTIYHYDVAISGDKKHPLAFNRDLIKALQDDIAPTIFSEIRAVFDGRKNLFSTVELNLGGDSRESDVSLSGGQSNSNRPPKIWKVRLAKVNTINLEVLQRFIKMQQSRDNDVSTALTAANVVIHMEPSERFPVLGRSFFTSEGSRNIGRGLILRRGYFQSIRPVFDRMLINVDTSTGVMYQPGPLIGLCLAFLNLRNPAQLTKDLDARDKRELAQFIVSIRVTTLDAGTRYSRARVVRKLSQMGADEYTFTMRDGRNMTVAKYFQDTTGRPLQYPSLLCVEVGSGACIPLELCKVLAGQLVKSEVPKDKTAQVVNFATMRPKDRLAEIRKGIDCLMQWQILAYEKPEYVRKFGLEVERDPLAIQARVLPAPTLKYGPQSKIPTVGPRQGTWNMAEKQFYRSATIATWVLIIFDQFGEQFVKDISRDFVAGFRKTGITVTDASPIVRRLNGQSNIPEEHFQGLLSAGRECFAKKKVAPTLFVVVLPEGGNEIYTIVKHWGDVTRGVATQCLKPGNCTGANIQFWANVALKINVKLGGINVITDPTRSSLLSDPHNPTVVMGADVMHPGPGPTTRPSYAAVVSSVDSNAAKYIATQRVQKSRQELITELKEMTTYLLNKHMAYRVKEEKAVPSNKAPKRLIFYRVLIDTSGCSDASCQDLKINPKITLVVVGKRHHIRSTRLFPKNDQDADRSGNCPAGTVVDRDIGHPTEFDFYLQSHAGIKGTSRPAHYSVLYDENNLTADAMQALSYALCYVYAGSTRSVSIPAPVYYADTVCARAKIHFDPTVRHPESESGLTDASETLEAYKRDYLPLHQAQSEVMYFSVGDSIVPSNPLLIMNT